MVPVPDIIKIPQDGEYTEILEELEEKLSGTETVRLITWVPVKDERGHNYAVLTNHRLILIRRGNFRKIGSSEAFEDYPFDCIVDIDIEDREGYDLLILYLKTRKNKKFMIPEGSGPKLTSVLRTLESEKKKMEKKGETATEKLEKLSELHDEGKLTEEEFQDKKDRLLDEI